uniref:Uncharacterized protein n=1 Tax=Anguilla anguilla TaxID=7936 RepID=A0A0E9XN77_ANGAN
MVEMYSPSKNYYISLLFKYAFKYI